MEDRHRLRATFDSAAASYADARPTYPDELIDTLIASTGITEDSRLLEIGCGPGTATLPLAERGFAITALEIGEALAGEARARLRDFHRVEVINESFETWAGEPHSFDLVYAATAWHWVDPDAAYRRALDLLGPGGHLAFWRADHVFPAGGDPFFTEIQEVYDEIGEGLPPGAREPRPGELPEQTDEIEAHGFEVVTVRHFDWSTTYDADGYLALLDTFSGHIAMPVEKRAHLYAEIRRRLATRPSGRLNRHWGAVLHVARATTVRS